MSIQLSNNIFHMSNSQYKRFMQQVSTTNVEQKSNKPKKTVTKVAIGTFAAIGTLCIADILLCKGKHIKSLMNKGKNLFDTIIKKFGKNNKSPLEIANEIHTIYCNNGLKGLSKSQQKFLAEAFGILPEELSSLSKKDLKKLAAKFHPDRTGGDELLRTYYEISVQMLKNLKNK